MGRRANGEGSYTKRNDGRWSGKLSLPNGERKSFYGKTKKEVQEKMKAAQRKIDAGLDLAADRINVEQYLTEWIQDMHTQVSPNTHSGYTSYVNNHLIPHLGKIKLSQLKAPHVNKMLREMGEAGLSATTQNQCRAILRSALNDAINADLLDSNAAKKANPAKQRKKEIVPLDPDQVQTLLGHTRGHRLGPLIHTAIGTGMRQGELLGLRWKDVDLDDESLRVNHSMQRIDGKMTFAPTKTEKSRRVIALEPSTIEALRRQESMVTELKIAAGDNWQEWDLVFPSDVGTPMNNSNVTHRFQKLLIECGLPRQRFHDLRHCAATLLYSFGGSLKDIQDFLGHSQISLTANTYSHLTDQSRRETANRMGNALAGSFTNRESG